MTAQDSTRLKCRRTRRDAPAHLVVPDDCDVRWRAAGVAIVGDVVMFGTRDPAGGEEERVELHAQRFPSHVLHRQLTTDGDRDKIQDTRVIVFICTKCFISFICSLHFYLT